jgi:dienelactone hydrolase
MRKLAVVLAAMFMLVLAPSASAEITSVFDGKIPCVTKASGVRECSGPGGPDSNAPANTVQSFDGTPIDVNVAFPDEEEFGPGPYPLAMYFHGFGGGKEGFGGDLKRFTEAGMAAFSMTERGFKKSCGKADAIDALEGAYGEGVCDQGFIHLMDTRYEVRDAQHLAGLLADEGLIDPKKIATVGASYGGAKSMSLAALRNRVMLLDGSLAPWKSPDGKDMEIAVAAPIVPPTDFAYSLVPNGRTLDYVVDSPYLGPDGKAPYGVMKSAIINALFGAGDNFSGDHGPVNPLFDVRGWRELMSAGEPYDTEAGETMVREMTTHHSSYYIDDSVTPAPMVIAEGLTDDLFPIDEAIRFYNRTKERHPDSTVSMLFADIGHPRAPLAGENSQGRPADKEMGFEIVQQWFEYYLLGKGTKPAESVMVKSQVCPYEEPSGGPYVEDNWAEFSPGELRVSDPTRRVIAKDAGDGNVAAAFTTLNPGCMQVAETEEEGTVSYDFPTAPAGGYTLAGAPTVIADVSVENGGQSQIAARLLEIDQFGQERVIARGVYRPDSSGRQVIQLHGNLYHFAQGTKARLQLLPKDGQDGVGAMFSYVRPSNDQRDVTISNVEVRLPVREEPGSLGGIVKAPARKVLPKGYELAGSYSKIGAVAPDGAPIPAKKATVKGKTLKLKVDCSKVNLCRSVNVEIRGTKKPLKNVLIAKKTGVKAAGGTSAVVTFKLTAKARKAFKDKKKRKVVRRNGKRRVKVVKVKGLRKTGAKVTVRGWGPVTKTKLTVNRTGKVK